MARRGYFLGLVACLWAGLTLADVLPDQDVRSVRFNDPCDSQILWSGSCLYVDDDCDFTKEAGEDCIDSPSAGDVESVGDCTSGACFGGAAGESLTFNDAGGDGTLGFDAGLFTLSHAAHWSDAADLRILQGGTTGLESWFLDYDVSSFGLDFQVYGGLTIRSIVGGDGSISLVPDGSGKVTLGTGTTQGHVVNGQLNVFGSAGSGSGIYNHYLSVIADGAGGDLIRLFDGVTQAGEVRSSGSNLIWDWFQGGASDVTLTHSSNLLEVAGGNLAAPFLIGSVTDDITACTTQTQGQCPLVSQYNRVTVVENTDDVVTLMAATEPGQVQEVHNPTSGNQIQVFPALGWNIGLSGYADNDPIYVSFTGALRCVAFDIPNKEWSCKTFN